MLVFSLLMLLVLRNRFDFGRPVDPNFERVVILVLLHFITVDDVPIWVPSSRCSVTDASSC